MNVKNDIFDAILDFLKTYNIDYERNVMNFSVQSDTNDKFGDIIIALQNFLGKLVIPQKRKVLYSKELLKKIAEKQLDKDIIKKIKMFKNKFKNGKEINSNLSRSIWDSQRLDYLFNIWNIKHLHLSESVPFCDEAMVSNRAQQLLFFIENKEKVCFLDVKDHPRGSGFTRFKFLEIIENNGWMSLAGLRKMDNKMKLINPVQTDDDIYAYAKNGVSIPYEINGNCYMSIGITSKSSKTEYTMNLIRINRSINILASKQNIKYISFHLDLNECLGWIYYKENGEDKRWRI